LIFKDNKLHIVLVTPEFVTKEYFSGGLANYIFRVSKSLISYGHKVTVIIPANGIDEISEIEGIQLISLGEGTLKGWLDRLTRYSMLDASKSIDFSLRVYQNIKTLKDVDIIQIPNYKACGLFTSLFIKKPFLLRISSYRPLWNFMSGENTNKTFEAKLIEWLEGLQIKKAKNIIAPSILLKTVIEKQISNTSIEVMRTPFFNEVNELDNSIHESILKDKVYILYFGRYQLHKGFHVLCKALPKILQQHPNLHMVFVGDDAETSLSTSMKEWAIEHNEVHKHQMIFINSLRHAQLYPVIKKSLLVVLPSLVDNMPNAALETMALGKPLVGTIGASFDEFIVDGENGFLTEKDDVDGLSAKVLEALESPHLEQIGERAQQTIEQFRPEK
jgi:glycosyltransferase involved in cell wall biosynthesis